MTDKAQSVQTEIDSLKQQVFELRLEKLTRGCSKEQREDIARSISQATHGEYLHLGEMHLSKALDQLRATKPHYFLTESLEQSSEISRFDALKLAVEAGDYKAYKRLRMSDVD